MNPLYPINFKYAEGDARYILKDATEVLQNDSNLHPPWVQHRAANTEFFIKRNKKSILINIGESWTYGETLPDIATAIKQYSLNSQMMYTFGAKMAIAMDCDFYQYAVPGNCNFYMFTELERIMRYVSTLGYEKIYICMQMTEPGRELPIADQLEDHPLHNLLLGIEGPLTFDDWLIKYDEIFFDHYNSIISKYSNLNISPILWKNFCSINTTKRDYKFSIIETSWIQFSGKCCAVQLEMPRFYSIGWLDYFSKEPYIKDNLVVNYETTNRDIDAIEKSNKFIKWNPLHNNHPSIDGHTLWANFLLRKSGWVNGI